MFYFLIISNTISHQNGFTFANDELLELPLANATTISLSANENDTFIGSSIQKLRELYHHEIDMLHEFAHDLKDWEHSLFADINRRLDKVKSSIIKGKIRLLFTFLGVSCVVLELLQDLLQHVPFIYKIIGKLSGKHGVLLLALQHLFQTVDEILDGMDEGVQLLEQQERQNKLKQKLRHDYASEKDAALAYDDIARELLGPLAAVNFSTKDDASDPYKTGIRSAYRGIFWNPNTQSWNVNEAALGLVDKVEGEVGHTTA